VRILTLGCALPDAQIDNYDWASAPSFFDYDAIVVDPSALSKLINEAVNSTGETPLTYDDEPVIDGPTTADTVGLADLLRRRRDETERLLARGGLVVVFAHPDVAHSKVSGFTGAHRYYWLPAPAGMDYGVSNLKPAGGTQVKPLDYQHPFADYLESLSNNVQYRALFTEPGLGGKVIGRSPGGAAIAVELEVGGGRIVFLPALPPRIGPGERSNVAGLMVTAVRNSLLLGAEEGAPYWVQDVRVPGITEARDKAEAAESALEAAEVEADEARNAYRALDRYRRFLWQEGKYGFDLPLRDALGLLGLPTYAGVDEPASFYYDGGYVFLETESSTGAVGMDPHYRLRQRLEERIAQASDRPRGVIVVNGFRQQSPASRDQQYTDALRVAAESMRYCVVTAQQVFEAVIDHLEGKGDDAAFVKKLIETEGIFEPTEAAEEPRRTEAPKG
jgi:hypothetical protein